LTDGAVVGELRDLVPGGSSDVPTEVIELPGSGRRPRWERTKKSCLRPTHFPTWRKLEEGILYEEISDYRTFQNKPAI
jgi:hypothetical protein